MSIWVVLVVLLLFGALGSVPWWGHSQGWGYGPSGVLSLVLVVVLLWWLLGGR